MLERITKWRRDLHQIPEVGFVEYKTAKYLYDELSAMGYHPEMVSETGLIVFLDFKKEKTLAFRSDIDALKITEDTGVDFASSHEGYMHACGHDGHMSALLGLAYKLKDVTDLPHNILLIFQPGEECVGGAPSIIQTGIFEKYNVKAIYGLHMFPDVEEGKIACRKGPLMAQSGELDVVIHGKSAHAGKYHEGIDSIMIASLLLNQYQTILSRMISPMQSAVINVGTLQGGTVRNIVASHAEFHGTVRTYSEDNFNRIAAAMKGFNKGMEEAYGCTIDFHLETFNPPVLNDALLVAELKKAAGEDYEELDEPVMLAEDFAHYQKVVPGVFFFVGTKTEEYHSGLHTPTFQFNETVLEKAVSIYEKLAKNIDLGE